jgi:hypothetical protein
MTISKWGYFVVVTVVVLVVIVVRGLSTKVFPASHSVYSLTFIRSKFSVHVIMEVLFLPTNTGVSMKHSLQPNDGLASSCLKYLN